MEAGEPGAGQDAFGRYAPVRAFEQGPERGLLGGFGGEADVAGLARQRDVTVVEFDEARDAEARSRPQDGLRAAVARLIGADDLDPVRTDGRQRQGLGLEIVEQ